MRQTNTWTSVGGVICCHMTSLGHNELLTVIWYVCCSIYSHSQVSIIVINTLRPRQNGRHFADYVFKCILLNENVWILLQISLNFVPKGPVNNIPSSIQIMAWRWPGDKPLSESMVVSLLMHICVALPQWINGLSPIWWQSSYEESMVIPLMIWVMSCWFHTVVNRISGFQIIKNHINIPTIWAYWKSIVLFIWPSNQYCQNQVSLIIINVYSIESIFLEYTISPHGTFYEMNGHLVSYSKYPDVIGTISINIIVIVGN